MSAITTKYAQTQDKCFKIKLRADTAINDKKYGYARDSAEELKATSQGAQRRIRELLHSLGDSVCQDADESLNHWGSIFSKFEGEANSQLDVIRKNSP
jgi:hypothetical protein